MVLHDIPEDLLGMAGSVRSCQLDEAYAAIFHGLLKVSHTCITLYPVV
jgi:hypothetical protein